jgi:protein TonB
MATPGPPSVKAPSGRSRLSRAGSRSAEDPRSGRTEPRGVQPWGSGARWRRPRHGKRPSWHRRTRLSQFRRLRIAAIVSLLIHVVIGVLLLVTIHHEKEPELLPPPAPVSMVFESGRREGPTLPEPQPNASVSEAPPSEQAPPATEAPLPVPPVPAVEPPPPPAAEQPLPVPPPPPAVEPPPPKEQPLPVPPAPAVEKPAPTAPPPAAEPPLPTPPAPTPPVVEPPSPTSAPALKQPEVVPPPAVEIPRPAVPAPAPPPRPEERREPVVRPVLPPPKPARPEPLSPSPPKSAPTPKLPEFPAPTNYSFGAPAPHPHPRAQPAPHVPGTVDLSLGPAKPGPVNVTPQADIDGDNAGPDWRNALARWVAQHAYYPEQARMNREDGDAKVHVVARPDGRVTSVELIGRSGSIWLDLALQSLFRDAHIPPLPSGMTEPIEFNFTMHYIIRYQ